MSNRRVFLCCLISIACGGPGTEGPTGATGATGATGPAGPAGMTALSSLVCDHAQTISGVTGFEFDLVSFSNGDFQVQCVVDALAASISHSEYFKEPSSGPVGCIDGIDMDDANGGFWSFTLLASGLPQATYTDLGSTYNGMVVNFAAADCTTYK